MSKSVVATQLAWWSSAIALPVVALQGRRLRRTIPRLPEAQGRNHGIVASDGDRLSITAIGESTVAGVGVTNHSEGIACRVAAQLCALAGREIAWHAIGMNGATIARVRQTLVSRIADHQAVVLVMVGVNDTLQLTSTAAWRREIDLLIGAIQLRGAPRILFTAVPPLQRFPALPQPTRSVLGVRSRLLDGVLQGVLSEIAGVDYLAIRFPVQRDYMASDGFHPSALGYDEWAAQIAARINDDL